MTRTRNPQRRDWWGVEGLWGDLRGEGEGEGEVVDRKCWTLHRPGSVNILELVLLFFNIPIHEVAGRGIESRLFLDYFMDFAPEHTYRLKREIGQVKVGMTPVHGCGG